MTRASILKAIGCAHLHLDAYAGYFVFRYENGEQFAESSVYVNRLSHMSFEQWVSAGKEFAAAQESTS